MTILRFLCALGFVASARAQYTNIVDPKAAAATTIAESINLAGTIAGDYQDANQISHGFERTAQGFFTTVDPPQSMYTAVTGLNGAGTIAGFYTITNMGYPPQYRGFMRSLEGVFTGFEVSGQSTSPRAIDASGIVTGNFFDVDDPNTVAHGFVRASNGTIATFDAPGAGTGPGYGFPIQQGTFPNSINRAGAISGYFVNQINTNYPIAHGFIRAADGTFITFDFPGAGINDEGQGTFPMGIDEAGDVAGYWVAAELPSGFLRTADGTFTNITVPGASGITVTSISPEGEILGSAADAAKPDTAVGFVRGVGGKITTFSYPGAFNTLPYGINSKGQIVGLYNLAAGSFLLVP